MSTRYEGAGAASTRITIHAAGEEIGDDVVPEGQIALAFNYDEVFYLQGSTWEVRRLLFEGIQRLNLNDNGLHVVRLYANPNEEFGTYEDIYDTPEQVHEYHPGSEILRGWGVIDGATGYLHEDSADWYDTEEEALAFISAVKRGEA